MDDNEALPVADGYSTGTGAGGIEEEEGEEMISKFEPYIANGWIRGDTTDDGNLAIYTYTDKCALYRAWDDVTRNARGHIYDTRTGECVARPFAKFFNLGENDESQYSCFDWASARVYEKLDGWLGVLYRHNGKMKVASRGSFHSDGAQWATDFIARHNLDCIPDNVTLCFEMISPLTKIILDYKGYESLTVLAAFDRHSGREYARSTVEAWCRKADLPIVPTHDLSIEQCLKMKATDEGREGFVVGFRDGKRVKIKFDWYLRIAKILAHLSPIAVWESMQNGYVPREFIEQIPEELRDMANGFKNTLESQYDALRHKIAADCEPYVEQYGPERKNVALNRGKLKDEIARKAVFAVLDSNSEMLNKLVMDEIYPRGNEMTKR